MRWRSWVIITPPKRDDPIYASQSLTIFLPQSGFVQHLLTTIRIPEHWCLHESIFSLVRRFSFPVACLFLLTLSIFSQTEVVEIEKPLLAKAVAGIVLDPSGVCGYRCHG